eukprot:GHVT01019079.1.p1 GENE.GHVT01019079.1~~GHVT01019079.1.p1  ORF type:complete len:359 (-),score=17.36 GHVT01019079.1:1390-2466(-)
MFFGLHRLYTKERSASGEYIAGATQLAPPAAAGAPKPVPRLTPLPAIAPNPPFACQQMQLSPPQSKSTTHATTVPFQSAPYNCHGPYATLYQSVCLSERPAQQQAVRRPCALDSGPFRYDADNRQPGVSTAVPPPPPPPPNLQQSKLRSARPCKAASRLPTRSPPSKSESDTTKAEVTSVHTCQTIHFARSVAKHLQIEHALAENTSPFCSCTSCSRICSNSTSVTGLWNAIFPWCRLDLRQAAKYPPEIDEAKLLVSYHGTTQEGCQGIIDSGKLTKPDGKNVFVRDGHIKGQHSIFTTPSRAYAGFGLYATPFPVVFRYTGVRQIKHTNYSFFGFTTCKATIFHPAARKTLQIISR